MKSISLLLAILAISSNVLGQTDKFSEAMKLKDASNYKDAFPEFQALMKSDSTNPSYSGLNSLCLFVPLKGKAETRILSYCQLFSSKSHNLARKKCRGSFCLLPCSGKN